MIEDNLVGFPKNIEYLSNYINNIVQPAGEEFLVLLQNNNLQLHHAYSLNFILAHALDHMVYSPNPNEQKRCAYLIDFDRKYQVEGSNHLNNKFQLLDVVNNSLKHVVLDIKRYRHIIETYGDINSMSLQAENGKVFLKTKNYTFDYGRVVLRPVYQVFDCDLSDPEDIIEFINGDLFGCFGYDIFEDDYEADNAIDRMIAHCNPICMDCGELGDACECPSFVYGDKPGFFNPVDQDPNFDFNSVMSQISGTRDWKK